MPRSRARTLLSAVASPAALADPTLFEAGNDLDVSVRRLREIWGVGEWTAQYTLRCCASRTFPAADIGPIRRWKRWNRAAIRRRNCWALGRMVAPLGPMRPSSFAQGAAG